MTTTAPIMISAECLDARAQRSAERLLFWRPETNEPRDLLPGDWVQIRRAMEWFWIRVSAIDGETITGSVDNDPAPTGGLLNGTLVAIEMCNVYSVTRLQ